MTCNVASGPKSAQIGRNSFKSASLSRVPCRRSFLTQASLSPAPAPCASTRNHRASAGRITIAETSPAPSTANRSGSPSPIAPAILTNASPSFLCGSLCSPCPLLYGARVPLRRKTNFVGFSALLCVLSVSALASDLSTVDLFGVWLRLRRAVLNSFRSSQWRRHGRLSPKDRAVRVFLRRPAKRRRHHLGWRLQSRSPPQSPWHAAQRSPDHLPYRQ